MVEKCILCEHRLEQGLDPACVVSCEGNCRFFGDIDDPQSEISQYYARNAERAFRIHPELGTEPSVIYLKPRKGASRL
jgi:Fe-S-cluster-containing dehydrogenase component